MLYSGEAAEEFETLGSDEGLNLEITCIFWVMISDAQYNNELKNSICIKMTP